MYNAENHTFDGHERPLKYIIAPGSIVYDVSRGWKKTESADTDASDPRTIKVATSAVRGAPLDFEAGDPIELAIGPDPSFPKPIRVRMFNQVPDNLVNSAIDIENLGKVGVTSAFHITGGGHTLADLKNRKDGKPSYGDAIHLDAQMGTGIRFSADASEAAILFEQPYERAQAIKWNHDNGTTALTVNPLSGDMKISGSKLSVPSIKSTQGLSSTDIAANNLRGINVAVPMGSKQLTVKFAKAETDANYSLNVQPNWLTSDAVTSKTVNGFIVAFTSPAGAMIDWQLIR